MLKSFWILKSYFLRVEICFRNPQIKISHIYNFLLFFILRKIFILIPMMLTFFVFFFFRNILVPFVCFFLKLSFIFWEHSLTIFIYVYQKIFKVFNSINCFHIYTKKFIKRFLEASKMNFKMRLYKYFLIFSSRLFFIRIFFIRIFSIRFFFITIFSVRVWRNLYIINSILKNLFFFNF